MMNFLICCLWFGLALSEKDVFAGQRLIDNENNPRELLVAGTISAIIGAIAGVTRTAVQIATELSTIADDGAKFVINNYFEDIELRFVDDFIEYEGIPQSPPDFKIPAATIKANGGVFSDEGPGVDSAGIVQYKVINPITNIAYCFSYLWASDVHHVSFRIRDGGCIAINVEYLQFRILSFGQRISNGSLLYAPVQDAVKEQYQMGSTDLRVGMNVAVSLPDGDEDHPTIELTIGPYKKIYHEAVSGNWFIFENENTFIVSQIEGTIGKMGNVLQSATECHSLCQQNNKEYFLYNYEDGSCHWINSPIYIGKLLPIYRYWRGSKNDHFYTNNAAEIAEGPEGITFALLANSENGAVPLYRYYNGYDHLYTIYGGDDLVGLGYSNEGILGYCHTSSSIPHVTALYRYNLNGNHFYEAYERTDLAAYYEGIECYVYPSYYRHILMNNINYGTEYELLENNRECEGPNDFIGDFDTTDQCWDACKSQYGADECQFFIFGLRSNLKKCYRTSSCSEGRFIFSDFNVYRRCQIKDGVQKCTS